MDNPSAALPGSPVASVPTVVLVQQLERALRSTADALLRAVDLTALQHASLSALARGDAVSSAELARALAVSPQAGNEMVLTLERKGFVVRRAADHNRRVLQISLTKKGAKAVATGDSALSSLDDQVTAGLSATTAKSLRRGLQGCLEAARAAK